MTFSYQHLHLPPVLPPPGTYWHVVWTLMQHPVAQFLGDGNLMSLQTLRHGTDDVVVEVMVVVVLVVVVEVVVVVVVVDVDDVVDVDVLDAVLVVVEVVVVDVVVVTAAAASPDAASAAGSSKYSSASCSSPDPMHPAITSIDARTTPNRIY